MGIGSGVSAGRFEAGSGKVVGGTGVNHINRDKIQGGDD
jgi:hypothetical protein